jgi:putative spermidine/putrescine transport system ATP-binding protein
MAPRQPSDILVSLRGVQKTYDGVHLVVRDLDLDIRQGEFLTLLGPSGSGKTTTLMMLAGFEAPSAGAITLAGRDLTHLPPHKRDIGVVFQSYALFPHMTVEENVAFPLSVRGLARAEAAQRAARALEVVQLEGLGLRRPHQLSGGQQQRVALARALVFEPQLVLMDEPLGALDKQLREQMQLEIRRLHERLGITVVYVTHDQAEALTLSDRIAVMQHGAIQQLDAPRVLYERPANAFVARFIGENNRLDGICESVGAGACVIRLGDGRRLAAVPVGAVTPGGRVTLSVRPERLRLRPARDDAANPASNRVEGRVLEVIYLGDHLRVRLDIGGGGELTAKLPSAAVAPEIVAAGSAALVEWPAADGQAFAPE